MSHNFIPKISIAIPTKSNLRYLKWAIPSLRKNSFRIDHDIIIFVDQDKDGTIEWLKSVENEYNLTYHINPDLNNTLYGIGKAYDTCIKNSKTDIVCIFHADMYACKDWDKELLKYISPGKVIASTRIEPPLHPEEPCKIVKDFGLWPELDVQDGFKEKELNKFVEECKLIYKDKITTGLFAPWCVFKKDIMSIGMHDYIFKSAREDSDLFNRFQLAGYELIQSRDSFVYHLTARGGQFQHGTLTTDYSQKSKDWQELMHYSTLEFIRKWGTPVLHDEYLNPIVKKKRDVAFMVHNCNYQLLQTLEPWCSNLYVTTMLGGNIIDLYTAAMQPHTQFDLNKKITSFHTNKITNDVVIEFDGSKLTQPGFNFLVNQLNDVIDQTNETGKFEYDIFTITINSLKTYDLELITLNNEYYTNKLL